MCVIINKNRSIPLLHKVSNGALFPFWERKNILIHKGKFFLMCCDFLITQQTICTREDQCVRLWFLFIRLLT